MKVGNNTKIWEPSNCYGCEIGEDCTVGAFTEITSGVKIGRRVIISSHSFICDLVEIEDDVFIGHGVMTINDVHPPSRKRTGTADWKGTLIKKGAMIGTNATILPVTIGKYAKIGAGSVVTKDVPDYAVVAGNPAKVIGVNDERKKCICDDGHDDDASYIPNKKCSVHGGRESE